MTSYGIRFEILKNMLPNVNIQEFKNIMFLLSFNKLVNVTNELNAFRD